MHIQVQIWYIFIQWIAGVWSVRTRKMSAALAAIAEGDAEVDPLTCLEPPGYVSKSSAKKMNGPLKPLKPQFFIHPQVFDCICVSVRVQEMMFVEHYHVQSPWTHQVAGIMATWFTTSSRLWWHLWIGGCFCGRTQRGGGRWEPKEGGWSFEQ